MNAVAIEYWKLVKEIANDDEYAVRFLFQVGMVSELYRTIDRGDKIKVEKAKDGLRSVLTEWIINPFVMRFAPAIAPAIASCIERYDHEQPKPRLCPIDVDLITTVCVIFGKDVNKYLPKIRELAEKLMLERQKKLEQ